MVAHNPYKKDEMNLLKNLTPIALLLMLASCVSGPPEGAIVIQGTAVPPVPTSDPDSVARGEQLYSTYCAACHGADLEGQPNWKQVKEDGSFPAPPHDPTGHTWHHGDEQLLEIIANGGDPAYGGTMPGFGEQLNEEEMTVILDFIKDSWGDEEREFQWWISAR